MAWSADPQKVFTRLFGKLTRKHQDEYRAETSVFARRQIMLQIYDEIVSPPHNQAFLVEEEDGALVAAERDDPRVELMCTKRFQYFDDELARKIAELYEPPPPRKRSRPMPERPRAISDFDYH